MILRRRGGVLRIVIGTSIFWLAAFYTGGDWWCKNKEIDLAKRNNDHLPAQKDWADVLGDGLQNVHDGNLLNLENSDQNSPKISKTPEKIGLEDDTRVQEKMVKGNFNPKVVLQGDPTKKPTSKTTKKKSKIAKKIKKSKKKGRRKINSNKHLRSVAQQ